MNKSDCLFAPQVHCFVALARKSYHVSELPNAAKNKIPDPMTNAAFFTESHSPPEPSCAEKQKLCMSLSVTLMILCNFMILSHTSVSHRNVLWCINASKTTVRLLLKPVRMSFQEEDSTFRSNQLSVKR